MYPFQFSFIQYYAFLVYDIAMKEVCLWLTSPLWWDSIGMKWDGPHRHEMRKKHLQLENKALGVLRSLHVFWGGKKNVLQILFSSLGIPRFTSVESLKYQISGVKNVGILCVFLLSWQILKDIWSKLMGCAGTDFLGLIGKDGLKKIYFHLLPFVSVGWWVSENRVFQMMGVRNSMYSFLIL